LSNIETKLKNLINVTKALRAEDGCPWDKKQTFETLRTYIIEEAYEVIEAIHRQDNSDLLEETGDLLLQVLFISNIAEEKGLFNLEDVIAGLSEKLIRRHPHVFGNKTVKNDKEALELWNEQKSLESKDKDNEVSKILPSLIRAIEISKLFNKEGLDFSSEKEVIEKLQSEIKEFEDASSEGNLRNIEEELGDVLFTIANLCRIKNVNPEIALNFSSDKFKKRAEIFLKLKNEGISDNEAWENAKLVLKKSGD